MYRMMSSLQLKRKREEIGKATDDDDKISNMPNNVIQQILECLPLEDAAKTSILSRHWRYKWASISQLILDEDFFNRIVLGKLETTTTSESGDLHKSLAYSKAINKILLSHVGLVCKFVLHIPEWFSDQTDMVNNWIQYVCTNGVKDFRLEDDSTMVNIPTCLFSCVSLTHLTLTYYHDLWIPPSFRGFPCLISLNLTVCSFINPRKALENLISKCPLLEILCLDIYNCDHIEIVIGAPKLQHLRLKGDINNGLFSLEGTTVIKRLELDIGCCKNIADLLSCLPKLEKLILGSLFLLDVECNRRVIPPTEFAKELEQLQILQLEDIPLSCRNSISLLLGLFRSSSNLKQLYVTAIRDRRAFDDEVQIIDDSCNLRRLKKVQLVGVSGLEIESQLIKLILASSPVMREMTIELNKNELRGEQEKYKFAKEVMRYRRASPVAEISFDEN